MTSSAFRVLAKAAAKQSAYDIFFVREKGSLAVHSRSESTGTSSIRIPAIS